jgi:3-hydroxybutyryl-CoA dehydrogenase
MREAAAFAWAFELMDLIGHDVNFAVTQSVFQAYFNDPRFTPSLIQQELVDAGYLGRKTGRGFYAMAAAAASASAPATEPASTPHGAAAIVRHASPVEVVRARYKGRVEYCAPRADNLP